jgi:hypothetical protein
VICGPNKCNWGPGKARQSGSPRLLELQGRDGGGGGDARRVGHTGRRASRGTCNIKYKSGRQLPSRQSAVETLYTSHFEVTGFLTYTHAI